MKLAGRVAAITGAARGIGRACAERFLQDGASVVIAVAAFGRLDIMVNNAGIARGQDFPSIAETDFDDVIGVNLKGAFFGTQIAARQMIAQGGGSVIVNMSSPRIRD